LNFFTSPFRILYWKDLRLDNLLFRHSFVSEQTQDSLWASEVFFRAALVADLFGCDWTEVELRAFKPAHFGEQPANILYSASCTSGIKSSLGTWLSATFPACVSPLIYAFQRAGIKSWVGMVSEISVGLIPYLQTAGERWGVKMLTQIWKSNSLKGKNK